MLTNEEIDKIGWRLVDRLTFIAILNNAIASMSNIHQMRLFAQTAQFIASQPVHFLESNRAQLLRDVKEANDLTKNS